VTALRRTGRTTVASSIRSLVLLVAVAATLAGCFDDEGPSAAPTPTRAPEPTPITTTYQLGMTAWYAGLILHFDAAIVTLDERGGPVVVGLRLDNPGTEPAQLNGKIWLVVAGTRMEATRESRLPTVPAGGSAAAILTYELQGIASVEDAVIEIGDAPLHVATIPLRPTTGVATLFEPRELNLSSARPETAGAVRIVLKKGLLRWDLPDWLQELDAGLQALTLTYDVVYAGDFAGGLAFTGDNVQLRLPDGTRVDPRADGHSQSVELIGPRKAKKSLFSRFEIPAGTTGEFALMVRSGSQEKAIEFTIED
jgi:hypothetical protein